MMAAAAGLMFGAALAASQEAGGVWMTAPELGAAFAGQTLGGYYPDGTEFQEDYKPGGTIDYREADLVTTGNWSIAGDAFCTFYKDVTGGCFLAFRVSENCFRFYPQNEAAGRTPAEMDPRDYEVTGWVTSRPSTCPPPPTV